MSTKTDEILDEITKTQLLDEIRNMKASNLSDYIDGEIRLSELVHEAFYNQKVTLVRLADALGVPTAQDAYRFVLGKPLFRVGPSEEAGWENRYKLARSLGVLPFAVDSMGRKFEAQFAVLERNGAKVVKLV